MSTQQKPLFYQKLLKDQLAKYTLPIGWEEKHKKILLWVTALTKEEREAKTNFLEALRFQYQVESAGKQLPEYAHLSWEDFIKELLKRRAKGSSTLSPKAQKDLKTLHQTEAEQARTRQNQILVYERALSALVNKAYKLTPEEEALLWQTAPPRMPFSPA